MCFPDKRSLICNLDYLQFHFTLLGVHRECFGQFDSHCRCRLLQPSSGNVGGLFEPCQEQTEVFHQNFGESQPGQPGESGRVGEEFSAEECPLWCDILDDSSYRPVFRHWHCPGRHSTKSLWCDTKHWWQLGQAKFPAILVDRNVDGARDIKHKVGGPTQQRKSRQPVTGTGA